VRAESFVVAFADSYRSAPETLRPTGAAPLYVYIKPRTGLT
jgi:hypothetical protein